MTRANSGRGILNLIADGLERQNSACGRAGRTVSIIISWQRTV